MKRVCGYIALIALAVLLIYQIYNKVSVYDEHPKVITVDQIVEYDRIECEKHIGISLKEDEFVVAFRNDTSSVQDVLDENALYVRMSTYSCKPCVEHVLSSVKGYAGNRKIVFLYAQIPVSDIYVMQKEMRNIGDVVVYRVDSLSLDSDEGITPYIFQVDKMHKIRKCFIPRKEYPQGTERFLSSL